MAVIGRMTETPSAFGTGQYKYGREEAFRAKNLISLSMRLDQRDGEVSKGGCPLCTRRSLSFQIDLLGADDYHIYKIQQPFCELEDYSCCWRGNSVSLSWLPVVAAMAEGFI
ncbi:hypothetical protein RHGRI_009167 [Rhododendron griersonianum]|uniref:Uncharacterized protein n=1 Tax=Rhododendron griersonianum TaxID=479676 RepID=A0AAV6L6H8_9ERIC|nr:hypothetical protein RHGRI_009167 [Rhododendron griersonianum]